MARKQKEKELRIYNKMKTVGEEKKRVSKLDKYQIHHENNDKMVKQ